MTRLQKYAGLSAALYLSFALDARANAVTDWNVIAVQTILAGGRPPGGSAFLDIATVHLAVHDAVAASGGQLHPRSRPGLRPGSPTSALLRLRVPHSSAPNPLHPLQADDMRRITTKSRI
jgi:hypothetical protein